MFISNMICEGFISTYLNQNKTEKSKRCSHLEGRRVNFRLTPLPVASRVMYKSHSCSQQSQLMAMGLFFAICASNLNTQKFVNVFTIEYNQSIKVRTFYNIYYTTSSTSFDHLFDSIYQNICCWFLWNASPNRRVYWPVITLLFTKLSNSQVN